MRKGNHRRARIVGTSLAAAVLLWGAGALRAGPITDEDIERAVRSLPQITDADVERAVGRPARPVRGSRGAGERRVAPNLDALPQPTLGAGFDIGAVTKGLGADADAIGSIRRAVSNEPGLLVFVSFAMPEGSLRRLVEQAEKARATLVLRGPTNSSVKETVVAVQRLIGKRKVAFQLDPEAFDRYGVEVAPTFVVTKGSDGRAAQASCRDESCGSAERFVRVSGDVSIDYALEFMERNAGGMREEVGLLLRRVRGS